MKNRHINSGILSVNFTDMTDDEFYRSLTKKKLRLTIGNASNLYINRNASFRGFRPV